MALNAAIKGSISADPEACLVMMKAFPRLYPANTNHRPMKGTDSSWPSVIASMAALL
jgi:hypothetical protein